jgi:hypothetical protein
MGQMGRFIFVEVEVSVFGFRHGRECRDASSGLSMTVWGFIRSGRVCTQDWQAKAVPAQNDFDVTLPVSLTSHTTLCHSCTDAVCRAKLKCQAPATMRQEGMHSAGHHPAESRMENPES